MLVRLAIALFLAMGILFCSNTSAHAIIRGGSGNEEMPDPGWPTGAAVVFNSQQRIAWWEDPPFGGGRWHSECQGNAEQFSEILRNFAKIESVKKVIVVHSGKGSSFWLDPKREKTNDRSIEVDWSFTVWQHDHWTFQQKLPRQLNALGENPVAEPTAEIHVYSGGKIDWEAVSVPEGIEVRDERPKTIQLRSKDGSVNEKK